MNRQLACNYTILRFLPYPETGEFVNLGVILGCPDLHWFDFQMETRRVDRITGFFPELKHNKEAFIEGRKMFRDELERMRVLLANNKDQTQLRFKENAKMFNQVFLNLVRPREEVFCFSQPRTCLTDDPSNALETLFKRYVERSFAMRPEYQETLMTRRLRTVFKAEDINRYYTEYTFGNDLCRAHFPFVRQTENRFTRAIHPLDLDKTETPSIVEHADRWKTRIERLKTVPEHPEHIMFVVRQPENGKRLDVCQQMCKELEDTGATIIPNNDRTSILDFAKQD